MSNVANPVVGSTISIELTVRDENNALVDLTNATVSVILKSPVAAAVVKTGTKNTPATDGVIKYVCATTDLNVPGDWQVQAKAVFAGPLEYYTNIETFTVDPKLE